jgi:glutamate-1-semialdehyde 2,1-aminomutase
MRERKKSHAVFNRSCEVIPGGVNSPVRACKAMGQLPLVVDYAKKDLLVDVDGHTYIDYCGSWGALIHGHSHPNIIEAVQKQIQKGSSFGITTEVEEKLAREITQLVSSVEKIRFVSSGTEATMSAVRLARGYTGKSLIVKFNGNYHGHADFFLVRAGSGVFNLNSTSSSVGIPDEIVRHTISLPYNDVQACLEFFNHPDYRHQIAAVILEPIAGNMGVVPASLEFLTMLREETQKRGALLIFDEVITGFRVGLQGAQGIYGIHPDLSCFGKIIGGGFPAAAFGGKKEIMDHLAPLGHVYQAGTLSGNPVAMEAGLEALKLVQSTGFYAHLEEKANRLTNPIRAALRKKGNQACIQQVGSMFTLFFGRNQVCNMEEAQALNVELYARLFRDLFNQGIYIPPSAHEAWFISSVHEEQHLEQTKDAIVAFIEKEL